MKNREKELESLYNTLLENDELYVMFDGMKGEWEKDKKRFIEEQIKLENTAQELTANYYKIIEDLHEEDE